MMYVVFIIGHIHHLMNESKIKSFAYNSNRRMYVLCLRDKVLRDIARGDTVMSMLEKLYSLYMTNFFWLIDNL